MANKTDIFADDFSNNDELINRLTQKTQVLKTDRIRAAFELVDRKDFVRSDYLVEAYEDYPLPIGADQTISQPTTVAFMLELLDPQAGDVVLDVGCGSGWTTALLAAIVGEDGRVIGLEVIDELVEFGQENLAKYDFSHAEIRKSDGGVPKLDEAPFDRILVSAAAEDIPHGLIDQLKEGGVLVMPINESVKKVTKIPKKEGGGYELKTEEHEGFRFVPFVSGE